MEKEKKSIYSFIYLFTKGKRSRLLFFSCTRMDLLPTHSQFKMENVEPMKSSWNETAAPCLGILSLTCRDIHPFDDKVFHVCNALASNLTAFFLAKI